MNLSDFIKNEEIKRNVSDEMQTLLQKVYEKLFIKSAQLKSVETSIEALRFAGINISDLEHKKMKLSEEIDNNKVLLTSKVETMLTEKNKEDFIKIIKKTKFIQREPFDFKFFANMKSETVNAIKEGVYEELLKLSPYKIAALVRSETATHPQIRKFLDLYKEEYLESEILNWIKCYGSKTENQQQILTHFDDIKTQGFFTEDMIETVAARWARMIGINVSSPSDIDKKAITEVTEIIRNNVTIL